MEHLIHRQRLELRFATERDARQWSQRLSDLNRRAILPELERLFTQTAGEGRPLRIDRLEIDLGRLDRIDLEGEVTRRLRSRVREALLSRRLTPAISVDETPGKGAAAHFTEDEPSEIDAESLVELFEQFFFLGRHPWWLARSSAERIDRLYRRLWMEAEGPARRLVRRVLRDAMSRYRFIEQLSNRSHLLTLRHLLPGSAVNLLTDLRKLAARIATQRGAPAAARLRSYEAVYALCAGDAVRRLVPASLARRFVAEFAQLDGCAPVAALRAIDAAATRSPIAAATRKALSAARREPVARIEDARSTGCSSTMTGEVLRESPADEGGRLESMKREAMVDNAGLVLLWPFFKELFRELEMLVSRADGRLRPRVEAVLLLQQLATGFPAAAEHELALNKLLCGIALNAPAPRRRRRSRRWSVEVDRLLEAAIERWGALKRTTGAVFRASFLQREGILLEEEEGDWLLRVDRKAYDILLDRLPWGIGLIHLSWMPRPLRVEW